MVVLYGEDAWYLDWHFPDLSTGVQQITNSVTQMDRITQSNAANAEESASASEQMSAQAVELNDMVEQLVHLVNGANSAGPQATARKSPARRGAQPALAPKVHSPTQAPARGHHAQPHQDGAHVLAPRPSGSPSPRAVIPLDEGDFKDF